MLRGPRRLPVPMHVAATLFAVAYALAAVAAMWVLSPRVPYADGWRHLGRYLALPFPQDVLAADNGHLELLPNLVRVAELEWLGAVQWLQVLVGITLAMATLTLAWPAVRRLPGADARAAGMLAMVLGVCWLGNFRALMHGNESVHAYAVTFALMTGLWYLACTPAAPGRRSGIRAGLVASACGLAAAFSFGSGIACFAAFGVVMLLKRSPRGFAGVLVGLLVTLVLVRLAGGDAASPAFAPARQFELLLRWLAAPPIHAVLVLLDPDVAAQVPVPALGRPLEAVAAASDAMFGPVMLARWPHLALGAAGLAWLGWLAAAAWRRGAGIDAEPDRRLPALQTGIGLSAFAVAAGVLVALMRLSYFQQYPDQLLAPRYLVWSSLFWSGLLLATVAHAARPSRAAVVVVMVAVVLLPSQLWSAALGSRMRPLAEETAVAAAAGVLDAGRPMGETVASDVATTLATAKAAGVPVFAWPEGRVQGRRVPRDGAQVLDGPGRTVEVVPNLLGGEARRVRFGMPARGCDRLLLVDADGIVRGLAVQESPGQWIGWMRGRTSAPPVAVDCAVARALPARR